MSPSFLSSLTRHYEYLKYFILHKWVTFKYCVKLGVVWRGITHDLSKLLPDEWLPYVRHFYGANKGKHIGATDFKLAWLKHIHRNDHHPFYWVTDTGDVLDMPEPAVREMVADWHGAAVAQGKPANSTWAWYYRDNYFKLPLSPNTHRLIAKAYCEL